MIHKYFNHQYFSIKYFYQLILISTRINEISYQKISLSKPSFVSLLVWTTKTLLYVRYNMNSWFLLCTVDTDSVQLKKKKKNWKRKAKLLSTVHFAWIRRNVSAWHFEGPPRRSWRELILKWLSRSRYFVHLCIHIYVFIQGVPVSMVLSTRGDFTWKNESKI